MKPSREPLVLEQVIVSSGRTGHASTAAASAGLMRGGAFVAIYLPRTEAGAAAAPPVIEEEKWLTLLAPAGFVAGMPVDERSRIRLRPSVPLDLLRSYLEGLLELDRDRLCDRQASLSADAVRALLTVALSPFAAETGLASRRRATLLGRVVAHIDDNLPSDLSPAALSAALACSRSSLYRATSDAGGVAELVLSRRLSAAADQLRNPAERRSIAAIARSVGLENAAQFNRRFKAAFGMLPGDLRRAGASGDHLRPRVLH